jgi:hypothetical protein
MTPEGLRSMLAWVDESAGSRFAVGSGPRCGPRNRRPRRHRAMGPPRRSGAIVSRGVLAGRRRLAGHRRTKSLGDLCGDGSRRDLRSAPSWRGGDGDLHHRGRRALRRRARALSDSSSGHQAHGNRVRGTPTNWPTIERPGSLRCFYEFAAHWPDLWRQNRIVVLTPPTASSLSGRSSRPQKK